MINEVFIKRFQYYKELGDKTLSRLTLEQMFWQYNEESNSIAVLVKHLAGNMLSRWTHFLTEDGEKENRNRDGEFENTFKSKEEILAFWEKGWACLFDALQQINDQNISQIIYIRHEPYTVLDAVIRQLAHYPYHIGQMIFIAKMIKGPEWESLSIPLHHSDAYNQAMKAQFEDSRENSSPVCYINSKEVRDEYKTK